MADLTVVRDVDNICAEQDTELVPCPICRKTFATKDIEVTSSCIYRCSATNKHAFMCQPSIQHKRRPVSLNKSQIYKEISAQLWFHQIPPPSRPSQHEKKKPYVEVLSLSFCDLVPVHNLWNRCF